MDHSVSNNRIGDIGARALAMALAVNESLTSLESATSPSFLSF
jgi:hypothetical protein